MTSINAFVRRRFVSGTSPGSARTPPYYPLKFRHLLKKETSFIANENRVGIGYSYALQPSHGACQLPSCGSPPNELLIRAELFHRVCSGGHDDVCKLATARRACRLTASVIERGIAALNIA